MLIYYIPTIYYYIYSRAFFNVDIIQYKLQMNNRQTIHTKNAHR